jgi:hypothetical protein
MEVPANGVQREPATALLDSLPAFETGEELTYPKIRDVTDMACSVITRIMGMGSDKSTFGQWFHADSIRYNADRLIGHVCQATMQLDGNRPSPDQNKEEAVDHLERALVRAAFVLFKVKKGKVQ